MNPSVDAVPRRGRAVNDIRGSWTTTFRPTVEVLRSFHPEAWPVFVILATCLIMAALYPFFAASNAVLVFTVVSLGCLVGSRCGQLAVWSGGILVPRYTGSLFALGVWRVVLATLLTGLACWSLGNPESAVAPAMLVGAAMMRRAIRRPVAPWGVAVWWAILAFATLCGAAFDGARQPLVQLAHASSALSHVWIQLGALVGVGLIVPGTRRAMALPTTGIDRAVQSPIGFGSLSREDLRKGVSEAAYALGILVLIWYFFPRTAGEFFSCSFGSVPLAVLSATGGNPRSTSNCHETGFSVSRRIARNSGVEQRLASFGSHSHGSYSEPVGRLFMPLQGPRRRDFFSMKF